MKPKDIQLADGSKIHAMDRGMIQIETCVNAEWPRRELRNVWYVPELRTNLFAACTLLERGDVWKLTKEKITCKRNGKIVLVGKRLNELINLEIRTVFPEAPTFACMATTTPDDLQIFHERIAHKGKTHIAKF